MIFSKLFKETINKQLENQNKTSEVKVIGKASKKTLGRGNWGYEGRNGGYTWTKGMDKK